MSILHPISITRGDMFFTKELPLYMNRVAESFKLQKHAHDFIEICMVTEGGGEHYIDDIHFKVSKGDLFYIPIGMSHVFRPRSSSPGNRLVVYNCIFTTAYLNELMAKHPFEPGILVFFDELGQQCRRLSLQDANGEAERIMLRMHLEYTQRMTGYSACLQAGLVDLLVLVYRRSLASPSVNKASFDNRLREWLARIDRDVATLYPADELASDIGISVRHLQRLIKAAAGMTLTEYIQVSRIKQSRRLLSETNLNISSIAAAVGYQDMKFYNRLFKQHCGMTPGEFRRRVSSNNSQPVMHE
ncbi:AraC family transcriptional regulator [Cohnella fermenti]|uniref:Helix-turn-helix domain-containing protein n=1 Tax=Cohnella fermenti TaxID=2565925 RepID=A0A4S4C0T9_9BACL|nr:helix-turn-helix domain-containing protein [Cohnella fermenti]THF79105.1 helix-turn-helix domain-containing protein [Cohnella fermenti]